MRSRSSSLFNFINSECVAKYPLIKNKKDLSKSLFNLKKTNLRLACQRDSLRLTICLAILLASFIGLPKKKFISDNFSKKFGTFNIWKINKPPNKFTLWDREHRYLPQQIRNYYLLLAYSYLGYFDMEGIRLTSSGLKRRQYFYAEGKLGSCLWPKNTASRSVVVLPSSYASAKQKDRLTCFATGGGTKLIVKSVAKSCLASYIPFYLPSNNNNKDVLISFSAGQDSVALLVLLFGIQSQSSLKLNLLWNHHLWHKDSFFVTRHVLKLSFLFKTSSHSAIAIGPVKTELQARQWRLKASRRLSNFYKYQNVMQAHSGTDKIETLLLNLFRGTGNISPFHSSNFSFNFSQAQKRKLFF